MKILLTSGARPNFMKLSPIVRAIKKYDNVDFKIVHTGQHYDPNMSSIFFRELEIPSPHYNLNVGSGNHGEQTGKIMIEFEKICIDEKPDIVVVIGDVNSTLACALVAAKLHIKVAHIESGLRSYDMTMPEEINRIVADSVSDYLFCTIKESVDNLKNEGYKNNRIHLVGDTMIDNLLYNINKIKHNSYKKEMPYIAVTLHRASNTDNLDKLESILMALDELSNKYSIVFPIHPRTENILVQNPELIPYLKNVDVQKALGYMDFLEVIKYANVILTDSGGLQIESAVLEKPCITMRENTEQVDTLSYGNNILVGADKDLIINSVIERMSPNYKLVPLKDELRDGKSAERIVEIMIKGNN